MDTLSARDQRVIWHPYTQMETAPAPIGMVRGEGALLFDEEGQEYIDATSSWWVNIHGHAHPHIANKIAEQAKLLPHCIFAGYTHAPAVELAERMLPILPGQQDRVFYSDNGSTAVEVALKMAIQYFENTGAPRKKLLAFEGAYHGDTFGAMSVSARSVFTRAFDQYLFDVIFLPLPTAENINTLVAQVQDTGSDMAAFIFEPLLLGSGGMLMYEAGLFDQLLQACKAQGILLIADEILTGFGRTGKNFAMENVPTAPDMVCLSKGLTGGNMALGITTCTKAIFDAFLSQDKLKTLFHGHSFTANPIACAAALASLDIFLDPACAANRARVAAKHAAFAQVLRRQANVKNIRQTGTIIAFEITTTNVDGYTNNLADHLHRFFRAKRVMLRPLGNTLYILAPYVITDEQLERVYTAIVECLEGLQ
ncbi:adenosylmethionine-8-amino-7-oxononanoate aminotransferase [Chitinophaga costaii]|uniref:Adenosylmethionine-8-amino-7-oxononanoate aminotransferase n=1 Tax=Chitinophaga costaii TaxID=1335309 RepID=A0A1C4EP83_9BACT|nr:adenosylmethionine--8-amino-7-oxononanoate transaminase [Chitinophaga costaii]PUZ22481.1 adenosylmethionine--8-amino-7-oxononanoate transaminase [Chitinophaga costaii]SCC45322.1 adenosylmethionine-8-amino-7-oxononanoate aminotransferase [Chitinophaga costaii]